MAIHADRNTNTFYEYNRDDKNAFQKWYNVASMLLFDLSFSL